MASCRWAHPKLVGFLLGELAGWQMQVVALHVRGCPVCVHSLEVLRHTVTSPLATGSRPGAVGEPPSALRGRTGAGAELVRAGRNRPTRVAVVLARSAASCWGCCLPVPPVLTGPRGDGGAAFRAAAVSIPRRRLAPIGDADRDP